MIFRIFNEYSVLELFTENIEITSESTEFSRLFSEDLIL